MRLKRNRKRIVTRREKRREARWLEHMIRTLCRPEDYAPLSMGVEYEWR